MASNSNINNKVTFWNNNSFTNNVTIINNIPTIKNQYDSNIDNNGIYFNNDLNAPHIMYNGYVFTAGSYVSGTPIDVTDNIYTIITSMSANTFSREISYNYTKINLGNIYDRLNYIETVIGRNTYIDALTITPDSCSIYAGDTYDFGWQTKTYQTPYFTGTDKNYSYTISNFGTLTINSDNNISFVSTSLPSENDNPITKEISLTSHTGTIGDTNYIGESKTISITVSKQTQSPTISTIPNVIYVGNSPTTVTVDNIKDGAVLEVKASNTAVIEVSQIKVSETKYNVTLKALTAGSSDITIVVNSTGKYKKYETTCTVTVKTKEVTNYYWYVGQEAVTADNYTTLAESSSTKYTTKNYKTEKFGKLYILVPNIVTSIKIKDGNANVYVSESAYKIDSTINISGYNVYVTSAFGANAPQIIEYYY